jgi:hypothetical protein
MGINDSRAATDVADATGLVKHPAKYSKSVWLTIFRDVAKLVVMHPEKTDWHVLDPFGGVGGIFDLHSMEWDFDAGQLVFHITSVEIEEEWSGVASGHPRYRPHTSDRSLAMDFFDFAIHPANREAFDLVVTSPTYGNRMADHHTPSPEDTSERNTYRHKLGRPLTEGSSASLQWGDEYREFHRAAWDEIFDLLEPGGYFILNVKDHIRKKTKQPVAAWHRAYCGSIGFNLITDSQVAVRGNRQGENGEVRVDHEHVFLFQKPFSVSIDNIGEAHFAEQSILKGLGE